MKCEQTIKTLEEANEKIRQKLPSLDESIKTYEQMTENYQNEKNILEQRLCENTHVIGLLKHGGLE